MVRAPRLPLVGEERERVLAIIRHGIATRPKKTSVGAVMNRSIERVGRKPNVQSRISVIDTHTGGEPTRVVIAGGPDLGAGTMAERLAVFRDRYDTFRSAVVNEPRGSDVMVGAILLPSRSIPACAAGVIFFNNVGYLGMCGHGTIGVAVALAHLGRIGPGTHRLETPVGTGDDHARRPQRRDDRQRRELPPGQGRERRRAGLEDLRGRRRLGRQLVLPGAGPRRDAERGERRTADRRDLADPPGA